MNGMLRELIALSVLLGLALFLCPEGGVKQMLTGLSAALLAMAVLHSVRDLDYDALALDKARLHEAEQSITRGGEQAAQKLNRLYIEQEYAAYILQRASTLGAELSRAEVTVRWDYEGLWVPESSHVTGNVDPETRRELSRLLRDELGIPAERQYWYENG